MSKRLRRFFAPVSIVACICLVFASFTWYYGKVPEIPAIANPEFKYWTADPVLEFKKPYLWEVSLLVGPNNSGFIRHDEVKGRLCLGMHIFQHGGNEGNPWATVHVRQNLGGRATRQLFDGNLEMWVYPTFRHERDSNSGNPENVFGIEINDGTNLLWIVFSQQPDEIYKLRGHWVVVINTPLNVWSYRTVSIGKYYADAGWKPPTEVALILLAGATRGAPGEYAGFVQSVMVRKV
jgi:hypothetical protein